MAEEKLVLVETHEEDGVARIILNRPEKRNALSEPLLHQLYDAFEGLRNNDRIGTIITQGAGGIAFCAGMDLHYLRQATENRRDWGKPGLLFQVMELMRFHPKVTIACVRGYCLGGGVALLTAHDLAVAGESAQIGMPEIIRGSFGQVVTSALIHAQIPMKKFFYIQLTGHNLSGTEAEGLGLVSKVVPDDQLESYTYELAKGIASHNHAALTHGKIAAYLSRDIEYSKAVRIDELVGARMHQFTNPFGDLAGYLQSQKGGTKPTYVRPDQGQGQEGNP